MKKFLKCSLSLVLALTIILSSALVGLGEVDFGGFLAVKANAATFDEINANNVFVKQGAGTVTCTLCASVNMMRRVSMLRGDANWATITESSAKSSAWISGTGLRGTFSYSDSANGIERISVTCSTLPGNSSNTSILINLLASHPEGIVIYNGVHAVLLTDYTNGVFYCNDPDDEQPVGRVTASRAYSVKPENATKYWYVSSPSVKLNDYSFSPVVSIDKSTTIIGKDTTFSFNAENATSVHLYIYQGTNKYFEGEFSPSETYTRQFFETGHYSCYLVAHTYYGDIESAWLGFDVVDKPTLSISSLKTTIWTDTTFTFNAPNADTIHLYIYQDANKYFEGEFAPSDTYTRQFGDATGYSCYIVAHYSWGDVESAKIYFNVLSKTYNVIYDANGGSGAPSSQTKTYGQTLTLSNTKPTRLGYTFLGWATSSTATTPTYFAGGSFNTDADTTLYAVWQKNHSHSYTETVTKAPACVETGVRTYKCSCGASYTQTIPATGHTESSWIIDSPATVNAAGSKHKECAVCKEVLETETIPLLKCSEPKLTKIENASNGIKITWGKVTGAQSYNVYRKTYSNGKWSGWSAIKTGITGTSYTDTTAKSGTTYTYTVRAKNAAGLSSYNTTGLKIKFLSIPKLTSISNGSGKVTVKWNKVTGASGYYVYRQTYSNGKWSGWKKVATTKDNYYNDTKVSSGNYYKYTVRAYNGNYISYYNTTGLKTKYLAVASLKSAVSQKDGIKVTWGKVTGAKGYVVYRQTYSNGKWSGWSKIKIISSGSTVTYTDKSAKKGVTYKYTVRATSDSYMGYYNTKGLQVKDKY